VEDVSSNANRKMDVATVLSIYILPMCGHSKHSLSIYSLETFKSRSNAGESNVKPY
jgi:hypothetical protein